MLKKKTLDRLGAMLGQARMNAEGNTDQQALAVRSLYPDWEKDFKEGDTLAAGLRVNYQDVLYKVLTEHQKQEGWNPATAPSLFTEILVVDPAVIPEWVQPESTNGYMTGDKVRHNGSTWESLVDNNVWEPGAAGTEALWKEIEIV